MAQFGIYRNPNPKIRRAVRYLVDIQSNLLEPLATRVVTPLVFAKEIPRPATRLHPRFDIEGNAVVMSTTELAGIPVHVLGERVASLDKQREEILAALDLLFTGI